MSRPKAFEIKNIFAGWFDFAIHGVQYEHGLSYLDWVKDEFDDLFNLEHEEQKHHEFDLESEGILLVMTYRHYDYIFIFLTDLYKENNHVFKHKYKPFIKSYVKEMEAHRDEYCRDFMYHDSDFRWDNENWEKLKDRLSKK